MSWARGFTVLAVVFALISVVTATKDETIFERTFRQLHQEPPPPEPATQNRANIEYLEIEQKLDNFNETETRTWQMVGEHS